MRVVVIGGGPAGALCAIALARRNHDVSLHEARSEAECCDGDAAAAADSGSRTISLALSERGLAALRAIDPALERRVLALGVPMRARMVHPPGAAATAAAAAAAAAVDVPFTACADVRDVLHAVSRAALTRVLLEAAEAAGVRVSVGARLEDASVVGERWARFAGADARVPFDLLVGADGAYSRVRSALARDARIDVSVCYAALEYKELTLTTDAVPASAAPALSRARLHAWPRGACMLLAMPDAADARTFTAMLTLPRHAAGSGAPVFAQLVDDAHVIEFFERTFPDAYVHTRALLDTWRRNPAQPYVTALASPAYGPAGPRACCVLVGDAAHATTPFLGQGANAALHDALRLARCVDEAPSLEVALASFSRACCADGAELVRLSAQHYAAQRAMASPLYRAWCALENWIERASGRRYRTRGSLVAFTATPYAEIEPRVRAQRRRVVGVVGVVGVVACAVGACVYAWVRMA